MLFIKYPLALFVLSTAMAGCSGGSSDGTTQQAGDFFMSVNTTPNPPEVGSNAEVVATIKTGDQPSANCKVSFQQHMPGMEMSGDETVYNMVQEGGSGVYKARGGEFSMGGDWVLEFTLACDGTTQRVKFPYSLKWPE